VTNAIPSRSSKAFRADRVLPNISGTGQDYRLDEPRLIDSRDAKRFLGDWYTPTDAKVIAGTILGIAGMAITTSRRHW